MHHVGMREVKFTEGPWDADDGDGQFFGVFGADGQGLCYLVEPGSAYRDGVKALLPDREPESPLDAVDGEYAHWPEHKANAQLMAAAPDLLSACMALLESGTADIDRAVELADAAIERALGKSSER